MCSAAPSPHLTVRTFPSAHSLPAYSSPHCSPLLPLSSFHHLMRSPTKSFLFHFVVMLASNKSLNTAPHSRWHGNDLETPLPESLRSTVDDLEAHNGTEFCVTYVADEEFDNLYSGFSAEFSSAIKPERGSVRLGARKGWTVGR